MGLPVILDADIGGEPDDAMALVIAARELPELTLVLTSDEMSGQRARFARLLLDAAGRPDVPVVAGRQLSATPCFFAAGLTPGSVVAQPDDVAAAVRAACGRAGGAARWIGLGPLSNLAALLSRDPGLAQRLFITQLTGTVNRADPALPPRNFRLDPGAARQVLSAARYLRLVGFDAVGRPGCEITAATPVFRELAGPACSRPTAASSLPVITRPCCQPTPSRCPRPSGSRSPRSHGPSSRPTLPGGSASVAAAGPCCSARTSITPPLPAGCRPGLTRARARRPGAAGFSRSPPNRPPVARFPATWPPATRRGAGRPRRRSGTRRSSRRCPEGIPSVPPADRPGTGRGHGRRTGHRSPRARSPRIRRR